jgi:protein involved in polysaccharide export with SLBB domain
MPLLSVMSIKGVLLYVALAAAAPLHHAAAQSERAGSDGVAVVAGDVLRVTVWGRPEMSGEIPIGPNGFLLHPVYREVQAIGVSGAELENRVRDALRQWEQNPRFILEPLMRVGVVGAVRTAGYQHVPVGTTVEQAVIAAGGLTQQAEAARVHLKRGERITVVELNSEAAEVPVHSGDVITGLGSSTRGTLASLGPIASLLSTTVSIILLVRRF